VVVEVERACVVKMEGRKVVEVRRVDDDERRCMYVCVCVVEVEADVAEVGGEMSEGV
jgi:hypothetical protein